MAKTKRKSAPRKKKEQNVEDTTPYEVTRYKELLALYETLVREGFRSISDVENALAKAQQSMEEVSANA